MLWVKAIHVIFVVAWFAGLFYLPRLFVYHVDTQDTAGHDRFVLMERKLYGLMTIAMIGTWVFGLAMVVMNPGYLQLGWMHAKLTLVIALSGYQGWLKVNLRKFANRTNTRSGRFWRIANEVPAVLLIAIVILVVVKPF
ncbi:putative membrane protein [Hydrocarboniphaga daqingensis]|jgi:putative membrane protein|uniref:Protoporphyrinogen IX oxidase n=1 Tax=Hydrocarboniphaga daqingensis TaxID=490188 RepID=A0A1M5MMK1_9GAMM|nr:protoporphyrinogen oxidase HemJ [Hydrocarboniphaga daqingensis]SHG78610.1 putative membrane protein [Hydrocarboniphaga daqingensis]